MKQANLQGKNKLYMPGGCSLPMQWSNHAEIWYSEHSVEARLAVVIMI
jgi:hypothetical protein